ncbi:MAG: DUF1993 domain-containing protein [Rhizobiaceae bacterium]|nr:DUF1993 domain-containing protein [Rhizobiaceae bacterium]
MAISMYQASVPVFAARLEALAKVLHKADANIADRKIDPAVILSSRLAPDMLPLLRQVQIATDHAKGASSRLAGREIVRFEDSEDGFAALQDRLGRTLSLLASFTPDEIDGSEERRIELKLGGREIAFDGQRYLLHFAMPNFYFHVTTAYAILRHNGVPLGKLDFMGAA